MQKVWKRLPQWLRDTLMFILIMGCAVAVCELLSVCYDDNNPFATSVFILAVVLVSRFTTGYWPGILASAVGVVSVNYLFTYPFHEFNLTIDGYPLTFAVMLVVSVLVSTLTTQIKRQEQLRYEAERDRMRANLLRSVSHDIRTPLTAIMGLSATVEESETLTDEGRGMVEEIHQNAQWLLHLSENILSVTRFCDEGVVIEKSDEVVEEIVGSAIRRFRKNCDTDIPITVSKPEEILLAPMDATLIEQVLLNLLENVAKHSPSATEVFIEIRAEGRRAWLTVADNGDGIPPQLLGVLFDGYLPLGAVEASDRSRHMGIGLSVCRAIVRAHGGEIYARNQDRRRRGVPLLAAGGGGIEHMIRDKIIIVEDDPGISKYLQAALRGPRVRARMLAPDGKTALEMIASHCPDLLLLDLGLPDMDGSEIIRSVRVRGAACRSSSSRRAARSSIRPSALDMGADDYLTKPFGTVELLARIRTALRHTRTDGTSDALAMTGEYRVGDLCVDYNKHRVFLAGKDTHLTPNEYKIVALLGRHAGQVLTYKSIMKELWGPGVGGDNKLLRVHMANIRRKIEPNPVEPQYIFTEVGVGYRMADSH